MEEKQFKPEVVEVLSKVSEKWSDPSYEEEPDTISDWRSLVYPKKREGDVDGMIKMNAAQAEMNIMEIANESRDEKVRLDANKFIVAQAGFGPMQKVSHSHYSEEMSPDQLGAIIRSKLQSIKRMDPNFDFQKLIGGATAVDAEFSEVSEGESGEVDAAE